MQKLILTTAILATLTACQTPISQTTHKPAEQAQSA